MNRRFVVSFAFLILAIALPALGAQTPMGPASQVSTSQVALPGVAADGENGVNVRGKISAASVIAKGNPEYNIMAFGAVSSADSTAAIQAAIDAQTPGLSPATGNYKVVIPPGIYIVSSPLVVLHANLHLLSTGGILYCTVTPCIHDGNGGTANFQYFGNVYENLRIAAGAANDPGTASGGVGAAIFMDGWKASLINPIFIQNPYAANCTGILLCDAGYTGAAPRPLTKYFAYDVQINNDQSAKITGMDLNVSNLRCDATFCGSAIYNPMGPNAAVGWITNSNLSMACQGNGIDWQYGNDLHMSSVTIQAFSEFAFRHNSQGAGADAQPLMDHVHIEQGGCRNPAMNNLNAGAGIIMNGGRVVNHQGQLGAVMPAFTVTNPGTTNYAYYIVAHNGTGNSNWSAPLALGYTNSGNATLGGGAQVNLVIPTLPNPFVAASITAYSINSSNLVKFTSANAFNASIGATVTISGTGVAVLDGVTGQVSYVTRTSFALTIAGSYAACTSASNCTRSGLTAIASPYQIKGDLLRVNQTLNGRVAPYSGNAFAVATNLNIDAATLGVPFIAYIDTTPDASLTPYTAAWGNYNAGYAPSFNFWPGQVVLGSPGGTYSSGQYVASYSGVCNQNLFNNAAQPGYVGLIGPNVFCSGQTWDDFLTDRQPAPWVWVSRASGGYNGKTNTTSALMLPLEGTQGNGTNLKGAVNMGTGASIRWTIGPTDAITVVDSNTGKTIATPGNRPTPDAGDTAVGIDSTRSGYAVRDSASISAYINSLFNGTSWLERLTATGKTFKVPVTIAELNVAGYVKNSSAGLLSTSPNVPMSNVVGTPGTSGVCPNGPGGSLTTSGCTSSGYTLPSTVPQWKMARALYVANGTGTCANARGCWQVTKTDATVTVTNAESASTQQLTLTPATNYLYFHTARIVPVTKCTGSTGLYPASFGDAAGSNTLGTTSGAATILTTAPSPTNVYNGPVPSAGFMGARTMTSDAVTISPAVTSGTLDQTTPGCAFNVYLLLSTTQ